MWIIGRTYQTGLERKVGKSGSQGGALTAATAHLHENHRVIDEAIDEVRELREPLDEVSLELILRAHGTLNQVISSITIRGQSTRSFVSKYLHFHCPIVPIYDAFAVRTLRRLVRWRGDLAVVPPTPAADEEYRCYTLRFLHLYLRMRAAGLHPRPSVRRVDRFLVEASQ